MANSLGARGLPRAVVDDVYLTPVHLNVGGTTYTTTLATLTRYPDSKLAKLFNGTLAITQDPVNRHYFLDVDGSVFNHILNFLRYDKLVLPEDFSQLPLLKEQVVFFELKEMLAGLAIRDSGRIKEESGIEDENVKTYQRSAKGISVEKNRDKVLQGGEGGMVAKAKNGEETSAGSDVVIMENIWVGSTISIELYSTTKLSLKEPLHGYCNLKEKSVKSGHCLSYSFSHCISKFESSPVPSFSGFSPCVAQFSKQLLEKGYKFSAVGRMYTNNGENTQYIFVRGREC